MGKSSQSPDLLALPAQQIHVLVTQLADQLQAQKQELLAIWGLTPLQYDALYALYHSDVPLSNSEISTQVATRVPDMTRLLDRMADKGWIARSRDTKNRRIMRASLTEIGTTLVESALHPLYTLYQDLLPQLDTSQDLRQLLTQALA